MSVTGLQSRFIRVGYASGMLRACLFSLLLAATACNNEIYVRDGVTDGDTFYLAPVALVDDDPALQSWVAYSLMRSTCQLEIGGANPARSTSFDCEYRARETLVDTWDERQLADPAPEDAYLDALRRVDEAGYLEEYVVHYFRREAWSVPADLDLRGFERWRRDVLPRHRPETRLVGSWGYGHRQRHRYPTSSE